jgi:hypothetical protein
MLTIIINARSTAGSRIIGRDPGLERRDARPGKQIG